MDFPRGFDRTNLQQICAQQCKNRKAASANLMQLTKEITHNLKPRRRQSKKNFNPCACASAGAAAAAAAAAATSAAINGAACVEQDTLTQVESRVCLDGQKAISSSSKHPKPRRGSSQVPSRGPALSPAMAFQAMRKLCDQLEKDVIASAAGEADNPT
ncbi:uncharacterized protein LOC142320929 isoform X2 [Lycorma delicatula]